MLKIFVCHFLTKLHPFFTYEGGNKENVFLNTVLQGQKQKYWAVFFVAKLTSSLHKGDKKAKTESEK